VAEESLLDSGIVLKLARIEIPEIQSSVVEEIAEQSSIWASQHLNQPVAVTDTGFYIQALNGFPGPFVKFVNEWLSVEDYLNLMHGKEDRTVEIRECLAYCRPGEEPVSFCSSHLGQLATRPGRRKGTAIEQLVVPRGFSVPISEIPLEELVSYWAAAGNWQNLIQHLRG
jgi:XTP/dITP diphosphohydrolase